MLGVASGAVVVPAGWLCCVVCVTGTVPGGQDAAASDDPLRAELFCAPVLLVEPVAGPVLEVVPGDADAGGVAVADDPGVVLDPGCVVDPGTDPGVPGRAN